MTGKSVPLQVTNTRLLWWLTYLHIVNKSNYFTVNQLTTPFTDVHTSTQWIIGTRVIVTSMKSLIVDIVPFLTSTLKFSYNNKTKSLDMYDLNYKSYGLCWGYLHNHITLKQNWITGKIKNTWYFHMGAFQNYFGIEVYLKYQISPVCLHLIQRFFKRIFFTR